MNDALTIIADAPHGLPRCRVCGSGAAGRQVGCVPAVPISLWPTSAPPHRAFDLELFVCERCGHLQLQTMTPDLVARFYEDGVFVEDNSAGHADRLRVFKDRFGEQSFSGRIVLDVGGGNNPFVGRLDDAKERWISDIVVSDAAVAQADRAVAGDFADADLPDAFFDLVTLFHTLEHFAEPDRAVARLARAVRPGGMVFIEVPNAEGYTRKVPHYAVFHQHQSYFHSASLDGLMARFGFDREHLFREDVVLLAAYRRRSGAAAAPVEIDVETGAMIGDLRRRIIECVDARLREKVGAARRIAIYGAGGSTTMFLTLLPWLRKRVVGVFDRDTNKRGRYVPGTAMQVGPPERVDDCNADVVIFLATPLFDLLAHDYATDAVDAGAILDAAGQLGRIEGPGRRDGRLTADAG